MKKLTNNNIYIQNNYIDEIIQNPDIYDSEEIIFASQFTPYSNKLYDYLLLNFGFKEGANNLKDYLIYINEYEKYVERILNGENNLLKCNLILYLEYSHFDDIFSSVSDYIDIVMNDKNLNKYKICNLVVLSNFNCTDEDIVKIKQCVNKLVSDDSNLKKKEKNELIKHYNMQIDSGHKKYSEYYKSYILDK